ncbi:hypothetical protein MLPF_3428 [Mycobacterium lepromatosis]|nr:hypothetical protein MLPF_3428 [Mycobacterium lepromatosis]
MNPWIEREVMTDTEITECGVNTQLDTQTLVEDLSDDKAAVDVNTN